MSLPMKTNNSILTYLYDSFRIELLTDLFYLSTPVITNVKTASIYVNRKTAELKNLIDETSKNVRREYEHTSGFEHFDFDRLNVSSDEIEQLVKAAVLTYVECDGDIEKLALSERDDVDFHYYCFVKPHFDTVSMMRVSKEEANCERRKLTNKMRYEVLKRDNYRCCFCGATGATTELVVDHIIPVSRGGKTIMSNLQTLCFECNNGKSDDLDANLVKEVEVNG